MILRESNIQLVHLTTNFPSYSKVTQNNCDNLKILKQLKPKEVQRDGTRNKEKNTGKKDIGIKSAVVESKSQPHKNLGININEEKENEKETMERIGDDWEMQGRKRKKFNKSVVYGKLTGDTIFKGVIKYADYHVFNCDRDMKVEALEEYLTNEIKIPNIICEKMEAKHPEKYSSFKISVPVNYVHAFISPEIWPEYVCINKYENRFLRKRSLEVHEKGK